MARVQTSLATLLLASNNITLCLSPPRFVFLTPCCLVLAFVSLTLLEFFPSFFLLFLWGNWVTTRPFRTGTHAHFSLSPPHTFFFFFVGFEKNPTGKKKKKKKKKKS